MPLCAGRRRRGRRLPSPGPRIAGSPGQPQRPAQLRGHHRPRHAARHLARDVAAADGHQRARALPADAGAGAAPARARRAGVDRERAVAVGALRAVVPGAVFGVQGNAGQPDQERGAVVSRTAHPLQRRDGRLDGHPRRGGDPEEGTRRARRLAGQGRGVAADGPTRQARRTGRPDQLHAQPRVGRDDRRAGRLRPVGARRPTRMPCPPEE